MKIGILLTNIEVSGKYGFYNAQEIGLAKALDRFCERVIIYKATGKNKQEKHIPVNGCLHTSLQLIPTRRIGKHGLWKCGRMDSSLDALIYFSDIQFSVPFVYRWCKKNNVRLYPYIGVLESHNDHKVKKVLAGILPARDIRIYRKCYCFAKTPDIEKQLQSKGINRLSHIPVGLDEDLLHKDYHKEEKKKLHPKYGCSSTDRILLFVGRLTAEKQPLQMIQILKDLSLIDSRYHLIMVGKGELSGDIRKMIHESGLEQAVTLIEEIPNRNIWEIYHIADVFVNLNRQEIYGMAILEAMYYECKVVAVSAPGPKSIIQDGITGYLADTREDLIEKILCEDTVSRKAHRQIEAHFLWKSGAEKIMNILTGEY